ncbi:MAG: hypothetical protein IIB30_03980 [Chloroflexi bacterium]|nr:hypothetical protein [Chloroflexota bacterium]
MDEAFVNQDMRLFRPCDRLYPSRAGTLSDSSVDPRTTTINPTQPSAFAGDGPATRWYVPSNAGQTGAHPNGGA